MGVIVLDVFCCVAASWCRFFVCCVAAFLKIFLSQQVVIYILLQSKSLSSGQCGQKG
jgi:hypothetical protein